MPSVVQDVLIRLTGFDKLIRNEVARRAQIGGVMAPGVGDDITGEVQLIEDALSQFNVMTRMHRDRILRYRDYDAMDNYGDISVALDIYAEEASQTDLVKKRSLWFTGDDQIVAILDNFAKTIRLHTMLFGFARQLAKYGDLFILPRYTVEGIDRVLFIPPEKIKRVGPSVDQVRHYDLDNDLGALSPRKDGKLLPWECVHMRILSFGFSTLYGRSMIEAARKRWLHLKLLEDAVAIFRLNRAVERLIYYIDIGQASPMEGLRIVGAFKRKFANRRAYLNPSGGAEFEQQYDPTSMHENIFWPVNQANERSRIEKLNPPPDQGQLQDLDHFNQKLFVALGIPKDFLTGDVSGAWNSKEALSLQDVRFSRKIHRLQVALKEGIENLCRFHLALHFKNADMAAQAQFEVHLADVSKVAQQQYDTILLNRAQLITMLDSMGTQLGLRHEEWVKFILTNFFPDLSPDMIERVVISDAEREAQQNAETFANMGASDVGDAQKQAQKLQSQKQQQPGGAAKKPATSKVKKEEFIAQVFQDLSERVRGNTNTTILTEEDTERSPVQRSWLSNLVKSKIVN